MPDDPSFQTKGCRRGHESSADAVRMNQIGFELENLLTKTMNYQQERSEITDKMIDTPGKSRLQTLDCRHRRMLCRQFHQWSIFGTHHHRVKPLAIQSRQDHQQQALGAARLTGVIVEKNFHSSNREQRSENRGQKSEVRG